MTVALSNYRLASANVAALLVLEAGYPDPPSVVDHRPTVEALRGGAIVLMVAALENYLTEAFAEVLDSLNTATPAIIFAKLPTVLQAQVVYGGLDSAMRAKPWDPFKTKVERLPIMLSAVERVSRSEVMSAEIAQTAGNPDSQQVKAMFKLVDYSPVFSRIKSAFDTTWGTPTATTFIENTLDTVVQRRHAVAHTASILSTSRADLGNWHNFLNTFVGTLDVALSRHFARLATRAV